jgi:lactoylglutathione lyase
MTGRRMLHTMLRIGDIKRSVDFYTNCLGMKLLRTKDVPDEQFTLVFLGYGDESNTTVLELTYNYGVSTYDLGKAYGHIAIGVADVKAECARLRSMNVEVTYERDDGYMAFIVDPDGYSIELLDESRMVQRALAAMKEQQGKL